jgi:hypothetical protein
MTGMDVLLYDRDGRPLDVDPGRVDGSRRLLFTDTGQPLCNTFPIRFREPDGTVVDPLVRPDIEVPRVIEPGETPGSSATPTATPSPTPSAAPAPTSPSAPARPGR